MAANSAEKARALEQCERDLDLAIERLTNLRLDPEEDRECGAALDGNDNDGHLAAAAEAERTLPVPSGGSPAEWAELLFDTMNTAVNIDDAKARAAIVLEEFQGSVATASHAELKVAVCQNGILKKGVLVQHRLRRVQEEANRELRRKLAACEERVRSLERDNYALSMYLRQALAQGSSMPGRFHPEVF